MSQGTHISWAYTFPLPNCVFTGVKADIKRCLDMREAFQLLDYEHASIATCKRCLVHAMISPPFLRAAPGRRFVAFICTLQPQLARQDSSPLNPRYAS